MGNAMQVVIGDKCVLQPFAIATPGLVMAAGSQLASLSSKPSANTAAPKDVALAFESALGTAIKSTGTTPTQTAVLQVNLSLHSMHISAVLYSVTCSSQVLEHNSLMPALKYVNMATATAK